MSILPPADETRLKTSPTALPTTYQGVRFRSRLEARWAVFFDFINVKWSYEPHLFDLSERRYLPDFHLTWLKHRPEQADERRSVWYEVKPNRHFMDASWERTFADLSLVTGEDVIVSYEMPRSRPQVVGLSIAESVVRRDYVERGHSLDLFHYRSDGSLPRASSNCRWTMCCDCGAVDVVAPWYDTEILLEDDQSIPIEPPDTYWMIHEHSDPDRNFGLDIAFNVAGVRRFE